MRKYVAFDIETAKVLPEVRGDLLRYRPLGIACAATLDDQGSPEFWFSKLAAEKPESSMTRADAVRLVKYLEEKVTEGYTIITWNGLSFDFDVLAEESGLREECRTLARNHIDLMFHIFCDRGFPVSLDSVAKGMSVPGKSEGVEQHLVPKMWSEGKYDEVLKYLGQDVAVTLNVARVCEQKKELRWITRKGTSSRMPLKVGWMTVNQALSLPLPDTSWMDQPMSRSKFTKWLDQV